MNQTIDRTNTRILIIDDEPGIRNLLSYELGLQGYRITTASNGEEGVDVALKGSFDLIVLDLMMPRKDGWQACKILKSSQKTKDTPVIVLTARIKPIDELRGWECGADEYMTKPVDYPLLLKAIKNLTKRDLERQ